MYSHPGGADFIVKPEYREHWFNKARHECEYLDFFVFFWQLTSSPSQQLTFLAANVVVPFAGFVCDHCEECHDAYMACKMDPRGPQEYVQPECCKATEKFYNRQPGLLKREFAADRFVVTSAKTYAMDNLDGELKRGIKGIS